MATATLVENKAKPKKRRRAILGAILPATLAAGIVAGHLTGVALLNCTSACKEALKKEIAALREQNDALRMQLHLAADDPSIRRWAEESGMVRVEEQTSIVVMGTPFEPGVPIRQSRR
ncbi:hypothetical protein DCOP10_1264 [Armatimonadetes bacterium DC]|nr:hypothetical protein DCOP10_1264 [Armatimonadetes bacterium DC]